MKNPISRSFFRDMGLCLAVAYVALLPQFYLVYDKGNRFSLDWSKTVRASILISIALLAAAYGKIRETTRPLQSCRDYGRISKMWLSASGAG